MAVIKPDKEHVNGLERVNNLLSEIRFINDAVADSSNLKIAVGNNRKLFPVDEAQADKVVSALLRMKESRTREIRRTTAKYGIELDASEESVLQDVPAAKAGA